jgi:uncharacterized membrane protein
MTPEERDQAMIAVHEQLSRMSTRLGVGDFEEHHYLDEYLTLDNSTVLTLNLSIDKPAMVHTILVYSPGSGTLKIGTNRTIPLNAGLNTITPMAMFINPNEPIVVTSGTAGTMFIEVMGNVMKGTNWRVL